jgi:hypothetical protein
VIRNNFRKSIRNTKGSGRRRRSRLGTGNINGRSGSREIIDVRGEI